MSDTMQLAVRLSPRTFHNVPSRLSFDCLGAKEKLFDIELAKCRRILVVKLDHIGDWTLCTPFLENLRRNAPLAQIDVLVLPPVFELASTCPHLDRVIEVRAQHPAMLEIFAQKTIDAAVFQHDYVAGNFDLAVVPRWDADFDGAARIAAGSGARFVVGFSEHCTRRKRVINRGDDRFYTHVIEDRTVVHEVEHNFRLLRTMGGNIVTRNVTVQLTKLDEQAAAHWSARQLGPRPNPLIALAPFASEPKREIPIRKFADLAYRMATEFSCRYVVIGGPRDRLRGARLAALLRPRAVSAAGDLSIRETAALIQRCDLLVGADSAPVHLAAAVGTPAAVLSCHPAMGSPRHANSPIRFSPWTSTGGSQTLVLQPALASPPCQGCCEAARPHCILGIDNHALRRLIAFTRHALGKTSDIANLSCAAINKPSTALSARNPS